MIIAPIEPERRAWLKSTLAHLDTRIVELRGKSDRASAVVARTLAGVIARFDAELAVVGPAAAPELAKLERSLADIQPRAGPYGLVINVGEIMDRVRHQLECRIAALRGAPAPAAPVFEAAIAINLLPVPEASPFTAGPQLSLFEVAA